MAQFYRVQVPPRVFTTKCCESQADATNDGGEGSGVEKPRVYLDKLDKKLEANCDLFVKSEMVAHRVMASVKSWLERKLRSKVSTTQRHRW